MKQVFRFVVGMVYQSVGIIFMYIGKMSYKGAMFMSSKAKTIAESLFFADVSKMDPADRARIEAQMDAIKERMNIRKDL